MVGTGSKMTITSGRNANDCSSDVDCASVEAHCGWKQSGVPACRYWIASEENAKKDARICTNAVIKVAHTAVWKSLFGLRRR